MIHPLQLAGLCLLRVRGECVVEASAEAVRRFKLTATTGARWMEGLKLDAVEEAQGWLATASRRQTPLQTPAEGGRRWLRLRALPAEGGDGEWLIDVEDITAEHEAVERMRLEGAHFHALIERSAEGISIFDTQAKILYESPSNERIHGYKAAEMEGRNLFDFCHLEDMARVMPRFVHLAKGPGVVETEIVRFRHKQGHYIYLEGTVLNAMDDPRVGGLVNNFRDVTARLEAERELRRAKDGAEAAQRLQQHWLANLSHEFKTPLTLIRGPLADLAAGKLRAGQKAKAWRLVERNIERLDGLLTELIDLARLEAGAFALRARQHDLVAFARRLLGDFAGPAEARGIALRIEAPGECRVFYDEAKLEKVLMNFLSNAVKFSRESGTIRVTIERRANAAGEGHVELSVTDEGPGMDAATCARVFERFFQGDVGLARAHEGMGIGLAIAREMVEMHGGTVRVISEAGVGSRFSFSLALGCDHFDPDDIDTTAAPEPRPHTVGAKNGTGVVETGERGAAGDEVRPRLLLVEDNPDMRAYLRIHLDPAYIVTEATNGREAWDARGGAVPDIVLSDVMMPHMDGLELCRRLKADPRWRTVPVVLLSAKGSVDHRVEGLAAGADDYLAKPFSVAELLQRLMARLPRRVGNGSGGVEGDGNGNWWEKLVTCIDANLSSADFDVETLAQRSGYSSRQLQRRVVEQTGQTPALLLLERRLRQAHALIEGRRLETVAQVAHAVGLSPGYFSRRYRQAYACAQIRL